jgi:hypothetical protein
MLPFIAAVVVEQGFLDYVKEQIDSFYACAKKHGEEKCALYFEALGSEEERLFFHADQVCAFRAVSL